MKSLMIGPAVSFMFAAVAMFGASPASASASTSASLLACSEEEGCPYDAFVNCYTGGKTYFGNCGSIGCLD